MGGAVTLLPVTDGDIPTCFEIFSQSFRHDAPFIDILYPDHDTPAGRALGTSRFLEWKHHVPDTTTFLKAVIKPNPTSDGGQQAGGEIIVGMAVWGYLKDPPSADFRAREPNAAQIWTDEKDLEYTSQIWSYFIAPRSRLIRESGGKGVYGEHNGEAQLHQSFSTLSFCTNAQLTAKYPCSPYDAIRASAISAARRRQSACGMGNKASGCSGDSGKPGHATRGYLSAFHISVAVLIRVGNGGGNSGWSSFVQVMWICHGNRGHGIQSRR